MPTRTLHSIRMVAAMTLVSGLMAGCSTINDLDSRPPQPHAREIIQTGLEQSPVRVGDVFVYDNPPMRWEVTGVGDHYVNWSNGSSGFQKTTWSTILPALRWSAEGNAGVRELTLISGHLHPLKKGNRMTFIEETVRSRPGTAFSGQWECEVQEQVEIVVKAGKSDTWQVLCRVDGRDKILFNYAENIGNAVRIIVAEEDGTKTITQLTGYARGAAGNTEDRAKP